MQSLLKEEEKHRGLPFIKKKRKSNLLQINLFQKKVLKITVSYKNKS